MARDGSIVENWHDYSPSKSLWFWSCVVCVIVPIIVGFGWGGWVTHTTAAAMSATAAQEAKKELAAAYCVNRFDAAPDAGARLTALKSTANWQRGEFIDKGGWAKLPGVQQEIAGATDLCAQKLISVSLAPSHSTGSS
jgi:hypothetical protein